MSKKITKTEYFDREGIPVRFEYYEDGTRGRFFGYEKEKHDWSGGSPNDEPISKEQFDEMSVNDYEKKVKARAIRKKENPTTKELKIADKLEREREEWLRQRGLKQLEISSWVSNFWKKEKEINPEITWNEMAEKAKKIKPEWGNFVR